MNRTWLLLDATQLGWAAFHTTGGLSYNNTPTGVIYGVLAQVLHVQREFPQAQTVFCFDHGRSHRYALLPTYKCKRQKRREESPREQEAYAAVYGQIALLKSQHLVSIGFKNIFYKKGFEADDLIASAALNLPEGDQAIIVSSDHDMFQLLRKNVSIYNLYKDVTITKAIFMREYGITPRDWVKVKSIAGCATDDIPGVRGVGEVSAAKYLRGELKPSSVYYKRIQEGLANGILETNKPLVKLPFPGTPQLELRTDCNLEWGPTMKLLGLKTLDPEPGYYERD